LVKIGTYNAKLKQEIGDETKRVTIPGMSSIRDEIRKEAVKILANDAKLAAKGIKFKTDAYGHKTLDLTSVTTDSDAQAAYDNAFETIVDQLYTKYSQNKDIMNDVNFVAAYEAHKQGISITSSAETVTEFIPTEGQINTIKKYDNPEELAQAIMANASSNNAPLNIPNILATARAADKDDNFISRLQRTLTADIRAEGKAGTGAGAGAGTGAGAGKPEVEVKEAAPFTTTSSGLEAEVRELIESGMQYNNIVRQLSKKYGTANVGNISSTVTKVMTDIQRSSPEAVAARQKAAEEYKKRQGLMSKGQ